MTTPRPEFSDHCPYCGGSDWDWPNLGCSWDEDDVVVCTVCRAIWMNGEWTEGNVKQDEEAKQEALAYIRYRDTK